MGRPPAIPLRETRSRSAARHGPGWSGNADHCNMLVSAWVRWIVGRDRGTAAGRTARRQVLPFVAFSAVGVMIAFLAPDVGADRTRWQFIAAMVGSGIGIPFMLVWTGEVRPALRPLLPMAGLVSLTLLAAGTGGLTSEAT